MKEKEIFCREEKEYAYWLCNIPSVGNVTAARLLQLCGSAGNVYHAPEEILGRVMTPAQLEHKRELTRRWRLREEYEKMEEQGISMLLYGEKGYPGRLERIPDAPCFFFYKGTLPRDDTPSVAVIGARDCSEYGRYVASQLGACLGRQGIQVVSGMARGIDCIGQQYALQAGGASFGVLGCGVDICYPAQNRDIYERMLRQGGVLSTYPPGTPPRSRNFPPRNRIVSALADAVVVVEARHKSGTLITVDMALEQGKEVYAVPGRVTERLSDGCNRLIRQGAGVFLSPGDLVEELKGTAGRCGRKAGDAGEDRDGEQGEGEERESRLAGLPEELKQVAGALDYSPRAVEEILRRLPGEYTAVRLNVLLVRLCMQGIARQVTQGYFCLKGESALVDFGKSCIMK